MIHRVLLCKAHEIITVPNLNRCWFHSTDPFCKVTFEEGTLYSDKTTSLLIIEYQSADTIGEPFHMLFDNGHLASTIPVPLDSHVYVPLSFFDYLNSTFIVNWTTTVESIETIDFMSNSVAYTYGTYNPMAYESTLVYDLSTEVTDTLLDNEFTVVVDMVTEGIDEFSMTVFSDVPIAFNPDTDGRFFYVLIVKLDTSATTRLFEQYIDNTYVASFERPIQHTNVTIRCDRTKYNQHATVRNLMVFAGRMSDYSSLTRLGEQNICVGFECGYHIDRGSNNIFLGKDSGYGNTQGEQNIAIGTGAYGYAENGANNICIGADSGAHLGDDSDGNICIGKKAGFQNNRGSSNIFVGDLSGMTNNGNNNIIIGTSEYEGSDSILIGNHLENVSGDGVFCIGNVISGDIFRNETTVHGMLRVEGGIRFRQSSVRMYFDDSRITEYLTDIFEHITLQTGVERFDVIQQIDEGEQWLDFKMMEGDRPVVLWKLAGDAALELELPEMNISDQRWSITMKISNTTVEVEVS